MSVTNFDKVDITVGTGTAASGAVTFNGQAGIITTEDLTTAAAAEYTLTVTNASIKAGSMVLASTGLGTSTEGTPAIGGCTVAAGSVVITVTNVHATQALNGTIKISFLVLNQA